MDSTGMRRGGMQPSTQREGATRPCKFHNTLASLRATSLGSTYIQKKNVVAAEVTNIPATEPYPCTPHKSTNRKILKAK